MIAAAGGMGGVGGMGGPGKAKKMKKGVNDKPKEGDVVQDPDLTVGRGQKVEAEDDPDVEKDKEDELGAEDDAEYKETSDTKDDKVDTEGPKDNLKKISKKTANNLAEMHTQGGEGHAQDASKSSNTEINLSRLNEIENQIRMITQLIPQIKDKRKRSSLVGEIAPILEEALEKFMAELT